MREIKFKTFDKYGVMRHWEFDKNGKDLVFSMAMYEGDKLMQYTGLKDKNGKEIYEGDVLEYDGEKVECEKCGNKQLYYSSHKLYEIKWNEELCEFDCENDENSMSSCIWQTEMEIIGNIYENPELLISVA